MLKCALRGWCPPATPARGRGRPLRRPAPYQSSRGVGFAASLPAGSRAAWPVLPSISAALASPRGARCSPLLPPSGYGQRAIGDCWAGVARVACGDDVPGVPLLVARRRVFPFGGVGLPPRPRAASVRRRLAAPSRSGSLPPSLLSPPGAALARPQSVAGRGRVSGDLPNVTRRIGDARNRAGASLLAAAGGLKARLPVAASGRGRL